MSWSNSSDRAKNFKLGRARENLIKITLNSVIKQNMIGFTKKKKKKKWIHNNLFQLF